MFGIGPVKDVINGLRSIKERLRARGPANRLYGTCPATLASAELAKVTRFAGAIFLAPLQLAINESCYPIIIVEHERELFCQIYIPSFSCDFSIDFEQSIFNPKSSTFPLSFWAEHKKRVGISQSKKF